ncbi:hypothetical protein C9T98_22225 [Salmonella enterica subsp. enterica serovar Enteritidis]|nr:hypothetical protein [Salmonella enterica subsp. enterica serovar Enteritidis]
MNNYKVCPVNVAYIRDFVEKYHYSHNINGLKISQCYALNDGDVLVGAIIFGQLTTTAWRKYGKSESDVVELRRMVVSDSCPVNTNTWFMARALKHLKKHTEFKVCVSYADPEHGHVGIVYQAANWTYAGRTAPDIVLETPEGKRYHSRALRTKYKGELKPFAKRLCALKEAGELKEVRVQGKYVYLYALKGKLQKQSLMYPKSVREDNHV